MRAMDGEASHFDHSLNALLLTSYIALKLATCRRAWLPAAVAGEAEWGRQGINALLNSLYDVHSSTEASDIVRCRDADAAAAKASVGRDGDQSQG